MDNNKQQHTIRVDDATWDALTALAEANGDSYRGRLSQGRVIERLVRDATQPAAPAPAPLLEPQPVRREPVRLADLVAQWPAAEKKRWEQDKWKAGGWVQKVLDTINAGL